jgi:hypothetical protein
MSANRSTAAAPLPVAFYGRFGDGSDPATTALHLARQYQQCLTAVPGGVVTAAFYDVGSRHRPQQAPASLELGRRRVRRDGGLDTLLTEAAQPHRRFDFVISSEMDRLSRQMATVGVVIGELESVGIGYLIASEMCAGEPLQTAVLRLRIISNLMLADRRASRGGRR